MTVWYMVDHGERGISGNNVTADWRNQDSARKLLGKVMKKAMHGSDRNTPVGTRSVYVEADTYEQAREAAHRAFTEAEGEQS